MRGQATSKFWAQWKPDTGFFSDLVINDLTAYVNFGFRRHGSRGTGEEEILHTKLIAKVLRPTYDQVGRLKQMYILTNAFAEYLNAGGSVQEGAGIINQIQKLGDWSLDYTDYENKKKYVYYDTGINTQGNRVHEFIETNMEEEILEPLQFVRWVENEYVEYGLHEDEMVEDDDYLTTELNGPDAR